MTAVHRSSSSDSRSTPAAAVTAKITSWIEYEQCCVTTQRVSQHWKVSRKRAAEWLSEIVSHNDNDNDDTKKKKNYRLTFCQQQQKTKDDDNEEGANDVPVTSECFCVARHVIVVCLVVVVAGICSVITARRIISHAHQYTFFLSYIHSFTCQSFD